MIKNIEEIEFERPKPLYQQVVDAFEKNIYSGKLLPGDKIPTTKDLSIQFNLAKNTVQQALTILVERGLVERITGRGTFISNRVNCKTIAIVSGFNFLLGDSGRFCQLTCATLQSQIEEKGWKVKLYIPSNDKDCDNMLFDLGRDCTEGRVRGIIVMCPTVSVNSWLKKECKVPYYNAILHSDICKEATDSELYRGLTYLAGQSLHRIAVIAYKQNSKFIEKVVSKFENDFEPSLKVESFFCKKVEEVAGYDIVNNKIIDRVGDFDALFVANDIICKGVMFALMEKNIKIPNDLAIMTHSNKGINILSPVPLTRIEVDPEEYAANIMKHIFARIDGQKSSVALLKSRIIVGQSCGE